MQVIEYIKEHGFEKLTEELGIKVKHYPEGLTTLNYCQINSPKTNPIVMECRGLILETATLKVVCRSFDRFFNLGEAPETQEHIDMNEATLYEKVDGSLIRIYHWNDTWYAATRGTAFAESQVNGFDLTFKDLVNKALRVSEVGNIGDWNRTDPSVIGFQWWCDIYLQRSKTYLFELTSMENRVVTRYEGTHLWFLGIRDTETGEYCNQGSLSDEAQIEYMRGFGAYIPNTYKFSTIEKCVEVAKTLPDLQEGYVLYQDGKPVCKIKSPAYVAVHHLRGEGLNPKRMAQLVLTGELPEYLKYFPEDELVFDPYLEALFELERDMKCDWKSYRDLPTQKEFAMAVKDLPYSSVLFTARKLGVDNVKVAWYKQTDQYKLQLLLEAVK